MTWGKPEIDQQICTKCGLCVKVCPSFVLNILDGRPQIVQSTKFGCLACGQCIAVCPTGAISVTGRGLNKADIFKLKPPAERADAKTLTALLEARRSVRHYQNKPLSKETIDQLLTMAATAPMGFPPTEVGVVVINGAEAVQEFALELCIVFKKWLFLATPVGKILSRMIMDKPTRELMRDFVLPVVKEIIAAKEEGKDYLFYNAPCVLLFHYPFKDTIDPTIACSFATVAAESMGLGSCIIGTVPMALQGNAKLKAKWGIPAGKFPSIAMILGYPDVKYSRGVRRHFASVDYYQG